MHNTETIYHILTLHNQGQNYYQISKKLNITRSCVKYNLKKYNHILSKNDCEILNILEKDHVTSATTDVINKLSYDLVCKAIVNSYNITDALEKLELDSWNGNHRRKLHKMINYYKIDISHLVKQQRSKRKHWDGTINTLLIEHSLVTSGTLKKHLLDKKIKLNQCECCGCVNWMDKPITLELHHINGVPTDHRIENLQILCPNCHSQTKYFKGGNRKINKSS